MEQEGKKLVPLDDQQLEDVDGGLLAELGLAAAMTFGQVAPAATMKMNEKPIIEQVKVQTIELKKENIELVGSLTENGQVQEQDLKVKVNDHELVKEIDYIVKNNKATTAGTYKLKVEGIGNYSGEVEVEFTIAPAQKQEEQKEEKKEEQKEVVPEERKEEGREINPQEIQLVNELTFTGNSQTQEVKVTDGNKLLEEGKDYTVEGNVQTNAGTYKLIVRGIGEYKGEYEVNYTIAPTTFTIRTQLGPQLVENGHDQVQQVTVMWANGGMPMKEGVDYTISGNVVNKAGYYTMTITGMGNFVGKEYVNFTVGKAQSTSISTMNIQADQPLTYNGTAQTQKFKVSSKTSVLKEGVDYKVENNVATKAGSYTATITGIGEYTGVVTVNYTIAQATLSSENVSLGAQLKENGNEQTQAVVVKVGNITLQEGTDYQVSGNVVKEAGNYALTVKGIGNYKGEVKVNFVVQQDKENVQTAEQTNIGLYAGVAAAAAGALGAGAVLASKKKKEKK
ncbi:MAG: hypothetical protein Q4C49_05585 [Bacillota bacterium]|nr:hypothetical protein [Bacillota bacterium]